MRVLVIEDHAELREALGRRLRATGYVVDEVDALAAADASLDAHAYDLLILDRGLPDGDGATWLAARRRSGTRAPVLMLTARDAVRHRVEGLEAGADDYLVKPFAFAELLARVSVLCRRRGEFDEVVLRVGDLEVDTGRREVRRGGVRLPLRPKEYSVLVCLIQRRGRVVSREQLRNHCWQGDAGSNVEEAAIASLRRKLGKPALIHTRRGAGYVLDVDGR